MPPLENKDHLKLKLSTSFGLNLIAFPKKSHYTSYVKKYRIVDWLLMLVTHPTMFAIEGV
jgi:hypothetical protein